MNEEYDVVLNILIVGEKCVGKTALQLRFTDCAFTLNNRMTLGLDYRNKVIQLDGSRIMVVVVDTMGQERYHCISSLYYRGAHGIILAYDVTDQNSFNNLGYWMEQVNLYARGDVCKLLVGCKSDRTDARAVEYNTAKAFADQQGLQLIETSARNGTNVEEAFRAIAADIMQRSLPPTTGTASENDVVRLHRGSPANNQHGFNSCCSSLKDLFKRRA